MSIGIYYNDVIWRLKGAANHRKWVEGIIKNTGFRTGNIDFIFAAREYIHMLNNEFLKHDYETDVLAFNYNLNRIVNGEIYISIENVRENSVRYRVKFESEVRRVMAHGVLHLCGYNDGNEKECMEMRGMEDFFLKLYDDDFQV